MPGAGRELVAALALAIMATSIPAGATPPPVKVSNPIFCQSASKLEQTQTSPGPPAIYAWDITFNGTCRGVLLGVFELSGRGSGFSVGFGLCDGSNTIGLKLNVVLNLESTRSPTLSRQLKEEWYAPVTTYPVVTPFFIRDAKGKSDGAGFLSHRVGLTCDDSASTGAATFSIRL